MKRFLQFVILLGALVALAVLASRLRERRAAIPAAGPPEGGEGEEPAPPEVPADDLARVWGIGPVYRGRLAEAGIAGFADLADADPEVVATAAGVPTARAADWIAQAAALAGR